MNPTPVTRPRRTVLLAAAVVAVLAVVLAVRLLARPAATAAVQEAPAAVVPAPTPVDLAALSIPCWSCPDAGDWPLRFRTDLDMLAPLGNGTANAAVWLGAFAKPDGPRFAEAQAAQARRVDHEGVGPVLPPDDPLLLEAEPWVDQATMQFYPDVFPFAGMTTRIPHLLLALTFARSWIARGMDAADPEAAYADFRRTIRLGRLLRQEDVVIISDLVGLACIRIGAEAIYDRARAAGDLELALAAAVVAGEAPAQKLLTAARLTRTELAGHVHPTADGSVAVNASATSIVDAARDAARSAPDRRFRLEAMVATLHMARQFGTEPQREEARAVLTELAASDDPRIASGARWALDNDVPPELVKDTIQPRR